MTSKSILNSTFKNLRRSQNRVARDFAGSHLTAVSPMHLSNKLILSKCLEQVQRIELISPRRSKRSDEPRMEIMKHLPNYLQEIQFHRWHLRSPSVNSDMWARETPWLPRQQARSKNNNFPMLLVLLWRCFKNKIRCPVHQGFKVSIRGRREKALTPSAMAKQNLYRATTWRGFCPATTTFSRTRTPNRLPMRGRPPP